MVAESFFTDVRNDQCPTVPKCGANFSSFSVGPVPLYVGVVSDSLSCVASVTMLLIYIRWRDIRKLGAQSIVTFIAISDFFTASAYLTGNVNLLVYHNASSGHSCKVFQMICNIESYIVTCATMSSYLWTLILAVYFYLAISRSTQLATRLMPLYHVVGWGLPVLVAFPLLCTGKLAYAPFVSGIWCYLEVDSNFHTLLPFSEKDLFIAVVVQIPEIVFYIAILMLFTAVRIKIHKQIKAHPTTQANVATRVNKILVLIPVLFILLRVWCTVQYFFSLYVVQHAVHTSRCMPKELDVPHVILGVLQAIGGGGQGWANAILYIFLLPTIRNRLFHCELRRRKCTEQLQVPSSTQSYHPRNTSNSMNTDSVTDMI